jgi:GAF domain-containing protein
VDARAEDVAHALVMLADTLSWGVGEHDICELLAEKSAEILGVTASALLVSSHGRPKLVATGGRPMSPDMLVEIQRAPGPCLEACHSEISIHVEDLGEYRESWPKFVSSVLGGGFRAVHAFPMAVHSEIFGGLTFFYDEPRNLSISELAIARAMTNVSTISLLQSRALREAGQSELHLQHALNRRIATEQVKGMIAERLKVGLADADDMLSRTAQQVQRRASDVAEDILAGTITLESILGLTDEP